MGVIFTFWVKNIFNHLYRFTWYVIKPQQFIICNKIYNIIIFYSLLLYIRIWRSYYVVNLRETGGVRSNSLQLLSSWIIHIGTKLSLRFRIYYRKQMFSFLSICCFFLIKTCHRLEKDFSVFRLHQLFVNHQLLARRRAFFSRPFQPHAACAISFFGFGTKL